MIGGWFFWGVERRQIFSAVILATFLETAAIFTTRQESVTFRTFAPAGHAPCPRVQHAPAAGLPVGVSDDFKMRLIGVGGLNEYKIIR